MLINFLHSALLPVIESDTISSEGFELCNLISTDTDLSQKGFLAERFISGPVTIRIQFTCPVSIYYVIIWPQVGSQKSSGFELSWLNDHDEPRRFATGIIPINKNGIIFCREGSQIDFDVLSPETKSFACSSFYRNKVHENVKTLLVKIFKSHFVPAVKKIEIWGKPHNKCDAETKNRVAQFWLNAQHSTTSPANVQCSISDAKNSKSFPQVYDFEIPEEFFDEITLEVMTMPMILPSGKIIDYSTLEKFQSEEAKWGRLPSDPFTGVRFTDLSKPVIATALKSNIDSFLIKYSDNINLKSIPRRLGSRNEKFNFPSSRVSNIVETDNSKRKLDEKEDILECKNQKKIIDKRNDSSNAGGADDSLNKLLEKTLHNLPSFISPRPNLSDTKSVHSKCSQCYVLVNLYRMPCSHILCRLCIVKNENVCINCKKTFSPGEIQKIHINKSCCEQ